MVYGISIYPQNSAEAQNIQYLRLAAKYGFSRLFVAVHGGKLDKDDFSARFQNIIRTAKNLGFEVFCDVTPAWVEKLGGNISPLRGRIDLSIFKDLGIDGVRLDIGMSEIEESMLSTHPDGMQIMLNASIVSPNHVGALIAAQADMSRVKLYHNYYPHEYTGLSIPYFVEMNRGFAAFGQKVTAFVSSQVQNPMGPWAVCDGLPTLECHRHIPLPLQVRHLLAMNCCESIMIGNAFASEEELASIAQIGPGPFSFHVRVAPGCPEELRRLFLNKPIRSRPDCGDMMLRSTAAKQAMLGEASEAAVVEPFHTVDIQRGDILVDNKLYGQYAAEVQLALQPMKNSGRTNVVASIIEEERLLLDCISAKDSYTLIPI